MTVERIAQVCHAAGRALVEAAGEAPLPPWEQAAPWQRAATIECVRWRIRHPGAPPAAQHDAWCAHLRAHGWHWGLAVSAAARQHPALVPYHDLSPLGQAQDLLLGVIVDCLLDAESFGAA